MQRDEIALSVYLRDGHERIREVLDWGTYGRDGDEPLHYILLMKMESRHIKAILETQKQIPEWRRDVFEAELRWRNKSG